jgi:uncharacterized protein YciI
MHFVVHCLDRPGAIKDRLAHYDAHRAHLGAAPIKIVISGPLVADDGETPIGSFFLLEAASRTEVEAFNAADPFNRAGIWQEIRIDPFLKRTDNR